MKSWSRENIALLERLAGRAALRTRLARAIAVERLLRKFDPSQPRVSAGSPDGGQWTSGSGVGDVTNSVGGPAPYTLAAGGAQSTQYCWNQMLIDYIYCSTVRPFSLLKRCESQAMERYAACLTGSPLPPLPF